MMFNYNQLLDKISRASGLTIEDVDRKVEAKCAKLSGLISKEGAAQIVASELGISFEKEKMKVNELATGMKKVNIVGKIINMGQVRNFTTKSGVESKVLGLSLADETGNVRTVLWDTNHISLFEDGKLKEGDIVEISNASIRNDELHLSGFSDIKISKEKIENIVMGTKSVEKKIIDLKNGDNAKVRAFIVQAFEPKFFEVCPECGKKALNSECAVHGSIVPQRKALLSVVLDDGSENIRAVIFSDQIKSLGLNEEEISNLELFNIRKQEIIGMEANFIVNVRNNKLFNTTEVIINGLEKLNMESLIANLK